MDNKLSKIKAVIRKYFKYADKGIHLMCDCYDDSPDDTTIYTDGDVKIDICYSLSHFNIYGLSYEEFSEVDRYYDLLLACHETGLLEEPIHEEKKLDEDMYYLAKELENIEKYYSRIECNMSHYEKVRSKLAMLDMRLKIKLAIMGIV